VSGFWWITSYVLLCFTVIALSLAVGMLYRLLGKPGAIAPASLGWPLPKVVPGQPFAASVTATLPPLDTGFYLLTTGEMDAFPAAMSLATVAALWDYPFLIIVRDGGSPEWLAQLSPQVHERVVRVDAPTFDTIGTIHGPVVVFMGERRVVEAATGLMSPTAIKEHFRFVAEPVRYKAQIA